MKKGFYLITILLLVSVFSLTACGGGDSGSSDSGGSSTEAKVGDATAGAEKFVICAACHGPDGAGVEGLGKDMTTSEFIAGKTDAELIEFIKTGRPATDEANTTGVDMPPKGGNPAFTDDDLRNIVAHIRTLQK